MRKIIYTFFTILLISASFYLYLIYSPDRENILVRVGDLTITKDELQREISYRNLDEKYLDKEALLQEMVERKLLLNKAYKLELEKSREIIREHENSLISKVRNMFLIYTSEDTNILQSDILNYYNLYKEQFLKPRKRYFATLFFRKMKDKEN
jgi:hypothetical protein